MAGAVLCGQTSGNSLVGANHANSPISQTRSRTASAAESAVEQMIADINNREAADKAAAKGSTNAAALEEQTSQYSSCTIRSRFVRLYTIGDASHPNEGAASLVRQIEQGVTPVSHSTWLLDTWHPNTYRPQDHVPHAHTHTDYYLIGNSETSTQHHTWLNISRIEHAINPVHHIHTST